MTRATAPYAALVLALAACSGSSGHDSRTVDAHASTASTASTVPTAEELLTQARRSVTSSVVRFSQSISPGSTRGEGAMNLSADDFRMHVSLPSGPPLDVIQVASRNYIRERRGTGPTPWHVEPVSWQIPFEATTAQQQRNGLQLLAFGTDPPGVLALIFGATPRGTLEATDAGFSLDVHIDPAAAATRAPERLRSQLQTLALAGAHVTGGTVTISRLGRLISFETSFDNVSAYQLLISRGPGGPIAPPSRAAG
jgi:hypothetical protein